ncbi:hypothetical protein GGU10DRAFT_372226 [Lentinula aff. detonsa]|uniref:Proline-rich protein n=1 Tax=Lentinula aff. detonsa TaxID=2804958 RepID=A0AA38NQU0_9AGAR|nr:hypothetical protein GGU10DRAFT_372226 [Lentinula aff. detonsa]
MPSFAELKQKAVKAKDATVSSVQNTKDRHTSVPLKKTNWNPYDGNGPPPPPAPRTNSWTKPPKPEPPKLPPPIRRDTSNSSNSPGFSRSPQPPSISPSPSPSPSPALPSRGPPVINRATRPPGSAGFTAATANSPIPSLRSIVPTSTPSASSKSLPSRAPSLPPRTPSLPSRTPSSTSYHKMPVEPELDSRIDWANLSPEDKHVFFSWLDEFFERSYGIVASGSHA